MLNRDRFKLLTGITVVVIIAITGSSLAIAAEEWNKTFGGVLNDHAYSVNETRNGGFIIAGWTESYGAGKKDAWLIKVNSDGIEEWNRTFGGKENDEAISVRQTSDGGYIITGYTESYGAGIRDIWLIKTDAEGKELWNRTSGGSNNDEAFSVKQTSDNGYILAGVTYSYGNGIAWIMKTDPSGNEMWNRRGADLWNPINGSSNANSVLQTKDGGFVFAGMISLAAWLAKLDANGNKQWSMTFGGRADWANSVSHTSDGGYILAGKTYIPGGSMAWLIKTDANGNQQWSRAFGGISSAQVQRIETEAYSVQQTADGGFILAGVSRMLMPSGMTHEYAMMIKTGADGNEQWNMSFGGRYGDKAYSVLQTEDGYIITGTTTSYGAGGSDAWLIKSVSGNISSGHLLPVYTSFELKNSTDIPIKYKEEISDEDMKIVLSSASGMIRTFDGTKYEKMRSTLSLEGFYLIADVRVDKFLFELDGYRDNKTESWKIYIEHPKNIKIATVTGVSGGGTLVPDKYVDIAWDIALKNVDREILERSSERIGTSWIIDRPGFIVFNLKDPESPAHAIVTVDLNKKIIDSIEKRYWYLYSFPIYFNITSNPDGSNVYLAKGGMGDNCGGPPYKLWGDYIGKTPLTYRYEYNETFLPFSGLFSLFSFNLTGHEDTFECINIYGVESSIEPAVSSYSEGSLEPIIRNPLTYNISAELKPKEWVNKKTPAFEVVTFIGVSFLIYLFRKRMRV